MFASLLVAAATTLAPAADPAKRLLLVTHSGGFIHDSVGTAEDVLKEIGPKHGFAVTCFRYTGDPADKGFAKYQEEFRKRTGKTVEPENCGRVNADTLKNFDAVLFFTTGSGGQNNLAPLTDAEAKDLAAWVKGGGAFAGTHCAVDTLYDTPAYGDLIGGYFKTHPSGLQTVKIKVDDPSHPAAKPFEAGSEYKDEIYILQDQPFSRDKVHVILSVDPSGGDFKPNAKQARKDGDYALSWCKDEGSGRVFYTAFGHAKSVWQDPKFQQHLLAGMKWALSGRRHSEGRVATQQATVDYLLEQFAGAGRVTARKMFGEYCVYLADKPVALVCDDRLYLKPTIAGRSLAPEAAEGPPYPGAKPHLVIPTDWWADGKRMAALLKATFAELPRPKAKKKPDV